MSFKVFEESPDISNFSTWYENGFAPIKWESSSNVSMTAELHVHQEWFATRLLFPEPLPPVWMEPSTGAAGKASCCLGPTHTYSGYSLFCCAGWRRCQKDREGRRTGREDRRKTVVEYCSLYVLDLCFKTKTENWYI